MHHNDIESLTPPFDLRLILRTGPTEQDIVADMFVRVGMAGGRYILGAAGHHGVLPAFMEGRVPGAVPIMLDVHPLADSSRPIPIPAHHHHGEGSGPCTVPHPAAPVVNDNWDGVDRLLAEHTQCIPGEPCLAGQPAIAAAPQADEAAMDDALRVIAAAIPDSYPAAPDDTIVMTPITEAATDAA